MSLTVKVRLPIVTVILTILLSILLSGLIVLLLMLRTYIPPSFSFCPEYEYSFVIDSVLLLIISILSACMIILLIRMLRKNIVLFFTFSIAVSVFMISTVILSAYLELDISYSIPISLLLSAVLVYAVFIASSPLIKLLGHVSVSSIIGAFLGLTLQTPSIIAILILFSLYDAIAVRKGPIIEIVKELEKRGISGTGISCQVHGIEIGMGDLVFYSAFASHTLIISSLISYIAVTVAIVTGVYISLLLLLRRREIIAGLPIPIGLGLLAFFLSRLLS